MSLLIQSELQTKTTNEQFEVVKQLYAKGYYNLSQAGENVTMIKGPSYDKTKIVIEPNGTYLAFSI